MVEHLTGWAILDEGESPPPPGVETSKLLVANEEDITELPHVQQIADCLVKGLE